jgi:uncharacterized Rmd1/YagE family protein
MDNRHQLVAQYVKPGLNLAEIERSCHNLTLFRRERNSLLYKLSETQYLAVYSFGAMVTVDVCGDDLAHYVGLVASGGETDDVITVNNAVSDDYELIVDPDQPETVEFSQVRIRAFDVEKLLIIFRVLAQSVAIDFLERQVGEHLQKFERMNLSLSTHGRVMVKPKEVMKAVGSSGAMMNFIIGKLSLLDKPDMTWEDKEAETLFHGLRRMYELDDRFEALRFKISFVQESSGRILDILDARHASFLEWIIIGLFVLDIAILFIE